MMKKNLLLFFLALLATLSANAYTFEDNGIYYIKYGYGYGTQYTVTCGNDNGNSYSGDVEVPPEVCYQGDWGYVMYVGDYAFSNCPNLTSVRLPEFMFDIGEGAFKNCPALKEVNIPYYTDSIGYEAFYGCSSLTDIVTSGYVTIIAAGAFEGCSSLEKVELGCGVTTIRGAAFHNCTSLTSVICLAPTPPAIENSTFFSDTYRNATLVVPSASLNAYKTADYWKNFNTIVALDFVANGIHYNVTSESTVEVVSKGEGSYYSGNVVIPSTVNHSGKTYQVTAIGWNAFRDCTGLTGVTIPESVTVIDWDAFRGCTGLTSVTIPNSVTTICGNAFMDCTGLRSVTLPDSLTEIYGGVFYNCSSLSSVTIPDAVIVIGSNAFQGCTSLTSVVIPNSVTEIYSETFIDCTGLTSISIGRSVEKIDRKAFYGCTSLATVECWATAPPEIVETNVFNSSTYGTAKLLVPYGRKSAYQNSFGWSNFTTIESMNSHFTVDGFYYYITGDNTVAVASNHTGSNSYSGNVVIPETVTCNGVTYTVTGINDFAFYDCPDLTSVEIPNTVTHIGESAFWDCPNLTSVTIGSGVTTIDYAAFSECDNLLVVTCMATTPPTIDSDAFDYATAYSRITLIVPYGCKAAYQNADVWGDFTKIFELNYNFEKDGFYYRFTGTNPATVELTSKDTNYNSYSGDVTIPSTVKYDGVTYQVTTIGAHAFRNCTGLTSVTIPNTVTAIGTAAFLQCTKLTSVVVPNSVTSIGNMAFSACSAMTRITIGKGVLTIGSNAFVNSNNLTTITCLAATPPTIQSNTFYSTHYSNATLVVPDASLSAYRAANYWKNFTTIMSNSEHLGVVLNVEGGSIAFTSSGDYPWKAEYEAESGRIYAISGNKGYHNSTSSMSTTVTVNVNSMLTFDFKAWGESNGNNIYDKCIFTVDGDQAFSYGQMDNDWETRTFVLLAGTHTLEWTYSKDYSVHPEGDYFAIDNIAIVPLTKRGDVNGDGQVNITDVIKLINAILSSDYSGIITANANVNGDSEVNITDVIQLINYVSNGQW